MTAKIVRSTSKGQITLPKGWRVQHATDNFVLEMHEGYLIIKPIDLQEIAAEEILFDAERDNDGKGIPVEDMLSMLKDIRNE